jgi:predicted RNA-binding protein YlxR (DUF448 family)
LLRVVVVPDNGVFSLVPDPRHRLPGRGAYLHKDLACFAKAERRRVFGRALRVVGDLDTSALAAYVAHVHGPALGTGATGTNESQ